MEGGKASYGSDKQKEAETVQKAWTNALGRHSSAIPSDSATGNGGEA